MIACRQSLRDLNGFSSIKILSHVGYNASTGMMTKDKLTEKVAVDSFRSDRVRD